MLRTGIHDFSTSANKKSSFKAISYVFYIQFSMKAKINENICLKHC
jgi:hypothetical protein